MAAKLHLAFLTLIPCVSFASSMSVSKSEFRGDWPLKVESGTLTCESQLLTFTTGGKVYAVNGLARGQATKRGWKDIEEVWKEVPGGDGDKIPLGPLFDLGRDLCN